VGCMLCGYIWHTARAPLRLQPACCASKGVRGQALGHAITPTVLCNAYADRVDAAQSWASSDAVRRSMQGNRGRDTRPEIAVRRAAHAQGLRYRVNARPLPGLRRTADMVFSRLKIAVFVDGCFWHGCPQHHTVARTNADYWSRKVSSNMARDADTDDILEQAGWISLRFWEHEEPSSAVIVIARTIRQRQEELNLATELTARRPAESSHP
jgi:DNA mismatch endonuclease, patch repair protein